jgi:AraC-like DNA-binding protein
MSAAMTITTSPSARSEWLETVAARCQWFVGKVTVPDDRQSIPEHASTFVAGIPNPRLPVDDLNLRLLLLDVAAAWGASLHEHAHARSPVRRCSFELSRTLMLFVGPSRLGAKHRFLEWARAFSLEFSRSHPVSAAHRAAAIIRDRTGERIDTKVLAARIGVSPQHLRREFLHTFGVTIGRHERNVRLLRVLETLHSEPVKIEAVAREAGYASKKNFYDIFKRAIGMTPMAFIKLPSESARGVIDRTRLTLAPRDTRPRRTASRHCLNSSNSLGEPQ